jgi:hypothetical protein
VARKKVTWKNGQPYGHNTKANKEVRFVALTEYAKLLDEAEPTKQSGMDRIKSVVKKMVNR